jgi:hypothetical protein
MGKLYDVELTGRNGEEESKLGVKLSEVTGMVHALADGDDLVIHCTDDGLTAGTRL